MNVATRTRITLFFLALLPVSGAALYLHSQLQTASAVTYYSPNLYLREDDYNYAYHQTRIDRGNWSGSRIYIVPITLVQQRINVINGVSSYSCWYAEIFDLFNVNYRLNHSVTINTANSPWFNSQYSWGYNSTQYGLLIHDSVGNEGSTECSYWSNLGSHIRMRLYPPPNPRAALENAGWPLQ